ncbi:Uncharacterized protein GBIM_06155 [Gryllus bimaculatus]|nr:Uncharacterized protein GBIM_06155 [Gryllus bimaculatus]
MFKKKANIPPRPKPPTGEMLIEDLQAAVDGDVFCNVLKTTAHKEMLHPDETQISNFSEHSTDPELLFEQVKMFVEINQNLRDIMKKLQSQNEFLQTSNLELKLKAEEIRKQAINALK